MVSRRFSTTVLFLLVIARLNLAQLDTMTVCPVNSQDYILGNRDILPFTNIMTPSEDSSNNPSQGFVDTASSIWCTAEGQGSAQLGSHVELIFTEPIVVEFFKSEGQIDTWVSNFSIQYSTTESGDDFMKYGVLEPSQSFIVESVITSTGYFSLERPIVARRLRFVINSGTIDTTFGRLCWRIQLFGCLQSRARQIQSLPPGTDPTLTSSTSTTTNSMPPSSQSLPPNTPANCPSTSGGSSSLSAQERQQEILIIVLPAALATIVVVLIIAFISILTCVCLTRRSPSKETPSGNQSPNNPLFHYDCPRPVAYDVPRASVRSRGGSFQSSNDTLHTAISNEVKNPMYITKQGLQRTNSHQFTSLISQVESSATNDYEMITDSVTMDNRFYELQRTNSQPSRPKPDLPAARTTDQNDRSSSYYASIPANGAPPATTVAAGTGNEQVQDQSNVATDERDSIKAHGYAKVHKPSNTQGKVGGVDHAPPANTTTVPSTDNTHQTAL